jgi:ligand-binding SRPBCC domain-containing protein
VPSKTQFVRVSTALPISTERAYALAGQLSVFEYVVSPLMSLRLTPEQEAVVASGEFPVGQTFSARLIFLKFIPGWMHTLSLIRAGELENGVFEIYTNEHGGPAPIWNHRLTFEPDGERACRYTDEIEIEGGLLGALSKPIVTLFFKFRQYRWRGLVRAIA